MKKLFFAIITGMMALCTMAQGGTFTVRGTFEGRSDSVTFIIFDDVTNSLMKEDRVITGEMLEATFELQDAATLEVWEKDNYMTAPAIPGETVEFYRDENKITHLRGSQFYLDYNEAQQAIEQPMMEVMNFEGLSRMCVKSGVPEEEVMKVYEKEKPILYKAFADALLGYVKAHPDQDASAALLAEFGTVGEESLIEDIEAGAALLTERARGSVAANLYKNIITSTQKEREREARMNALEGNKAPDFTLMDINGKPLALSSLRGKWVVVDFWGSWCGWCIKGIPQMKEYYAKYSNKMEILGVDCNDTVEKWKAAVAEHEIPWLHIYWDKDDENCDNPLALYGVSGFPTKVVINPEGQVTKVIVGEDPAFYDYLDEVLK